MSVIGFGNRLHENVQAVRGDELHGRTLTETRIRFHQRRWIEILSPSGSDRQSVLLDVMGVGQLMDEVPLILSFPFELSPGIVVPQVVANVDIWPTILDLLGLPAPAYAHGRSLLPLIEAAARGESVAFDRPVFSEIDRTWGRPKAAPDPLIAVTQGRYRATRALAPGKEHDVEYFDHAEDPWEAKNLALPKNGGSGTLPLELAQLLDGYLGMPPANWGEPREVHLDEMELNQLRALGYELE